MALNFKWYGKELQLVINAQALLALEEACNLVEKTAKASIGQVPSPSPPGHAPASVTGTLKARITHKIDKAVMIGQVGTNLEYARALELGTPNMAPRPYLRPALEINRAAIKKLFGAK